MYDRQNHELEAVHEELFQAKMELSQTREELIHNNAQKEKLSSEVIVVTLYLILNSASFSILCFVKIVLYLTFMFLSASKIEGTVY